MAQQGLSAVSTLGASRKRLRTGMCLVFFAASFMTRADSWGYALRAATTCSATLRLILAGVVAMWRDVGPAELLDDPAVRRAVEIGQPWVMQRQRVEHRRVPHETQALGRLLGGQVARLHLGDQRAQPRRLEALGEAPELGQAVQCRPIGDEDPQAGRQLLGPELLELALAERPLEVAELGGELAEASFGPLETLGEPWEPAV